MQSQRSTRFVIERAGRSAFTRGLVRAAICAAVAGLAAGCASFRPAPVDYQPQLERAQSQTNGPIVASVAVLSQRETTRMFDLPLHKQHIQPIWLRLENTHTNAYWFLPASLDPNYFSSAEVAYMFRKTWAGNRNRRVADFMESRSMPLVLPPQSTREGFVFSTLDRGAKHMWVELLGEMDFRRFEFLTTAPERRFDFQRVDFEALYATTAIPDYSRQELRAVLESLPQAVGDRQGGGSGDPVNLVVVGNEGEIGLAFARQGWDITEVLTFGNVFKLIGSFLFNRTWENSPVSSLYLFGRRQDLALQKARTTIHERNHLRLWLAPFTCEGQVVLVGQISRDIGLRFTFKAPGWVTHKIDPDVDEARDYLAQEMVSSGSVETITRVGGVGKVSREEPQRNLTGDPYFTDGKRLVLFLSSETMPISRIHLEDWTTAPRE
ncbi:MAG: LssY C-terminal domain-containing protein [Verrucomicrobiales bacterium]|nr:LssY C-terminal domain-containing protein [Verrucomicrobiales bacterium]